MLRDETIWKCTVILSMIELFSIRLEAIAHYYVEVRTF